MPTSVSIPPDISPWAPYGELLNPQPDRIVRVLEDNPDALPPSNQAASDLSLAIPRPEGGFSSLRSELRNLRDIPPFSAFLGLDDKAQRVFAPLHYLGVGNILIAGNETAGTIPLLKSILLSLAFANQRIELQMGLIDVKREALRSLSTLPHLMEPLIHEIPTTLDFLQRLNQEVVSRHSEQEVAPRIAVAIHNLHYLLVASDTLAHQITDLLMQISIKGPKVGVHLIMDTQQPAATLLQTLLKNGIPALRLVGKLNTPQEAEVATGIANSGTEHFASNGSFLAIDANGEKTHFQACVSQENEAVT